MKENELPNKLLYRETEWYRDAGNSEMIRKKIKCNEEGAS
jgi:hypothetical protein